MNNNAKLTGLAHIGIFTADVDKSVAFYESLGFHKDAESIPRCHYIGCCGLFRFWRKCRWIWDGKGPRPCFVGGLKRCLGRRCH